ncbi:MAG: hypothetical protein ACYDBI_05830 [Thermoplasmataceae archaeon]
MTLLKKILSDISTEKDNATFEAASVGFVLIVLASIIWASIELWKSGHLLWHEIAAFYGATFAGYGSARLMKKGSEHNDGTP